MPIDVFISYAHEDIKLLKELEAHLGQLQKSGIINGWHDGHILPGSEWRPQIIDRLNTANVILLLVSADFINSDFCYGIEMQRAIERHNAKEACVLPIILRPVDWEYAPFAKLQVLPTAGKPVSDWPTHDHAFRDIVKGIRQAIEDLNKGAATP
jgi:hypothetical protein